jgi:hypothetical protein
MLAVGLCILAFCSTFLTSRRSLWQGILVLLTWGYYYGILRANLQAGYAHFLFDAAIVALYIAQLDRALNASEKRRTGALRSWLVCLVGWPLVVCFFPFQPLLVSLVGLRGSAFLLPIALLGARLTGPDVARLGAGLAGLNLTVLGFAAAEYIYGIEGFYPLSPVTQIIYASRDVAGYTAHRIPATFANAHAYAGTMVMTLPFLFGAWAVEGRRQYQRGLMLGMVAAGLGVLMAATRTHFVVMLAVVTFAVLMGRIEGRQRVALLAAVAVLTLLTLRNARFQRFTTLADREMVENRIAGSVNRKFWEILAEYPWGNGLGGGGTSIPYFLAERVNNPIAMENEYARILGEQGIPGLLIWMFFIGWFITRRSALMNVPWADGRRVAWFACCCYLGIGLTGTGLLTSVPQAALMMINLGWAATPPAGPAHAQQIAPGRAGWQPIETVYAR